MSTSFLEAVVIRRADVEYERQKAERRKQIEANVLLARQAMANEERLKAENKAWMELNKRLQLGCWPLSEKGGMCGFATGALAALCQPKTKLQLPELYVGVSHLLCLQSLIHCPDDNAVVVLLLESPTLPR